MQTRDEAEQGGLGEQPSGHRLDHGRSAPSGKRRSDLDALLVCGASVPVRSLSALPAPGDRASDRVALRAPSVRGLRDPDLPSVWVRTDCCRPECTRGFGTTATTISQHERGRWLLRLHWVRRPMVMRAQRSEVDPRHHPLSTATVHPPARRKQGCRPMRHHGRSASAQLSTQTTDPGSVCTATRRQSAFRFVCCAAAEATHRPGRVIAGRSLTIAGRERSWRRSARTASGGGRSRQGTGINVEFRGWMNEPHAGFEARL